MQSPNPTPPLVRKPKRVIESFGQPPADAGAIEKRVRALLAAVAAGLPEAARADD